jgi:hypothetical protein
MGNQKNRLTATKTVNHLVRLFYNRASKDAPFRNVLLGTRLAFGRRLQRPQFAFEVALQGSWDPAYPRPPAQRLPQRVHQVETYRAVCAVAGRAQRARSRPGARAVAAAIRVGRLV